MKLDEKLDEIMTFVFVKQIRGEERVKKNKEKMKKLLDEYCKLKEASK